MFGGEKMFKKIGALVLVVLLVSGSLVLISKESEVKAFEIEYLYVGEGKEHSTISSALENASDGDRILVSEGYYTESLILNKSIYLLGSGQERSAISGQNEPILLGVTADGCHISDLAFLGVEETEIGILLGSDANTVKNCRFHGIRLPLKLEGSSDNLIENNTFVYNGDPVSSDDDNRITTGLMAYWAMEDDNWIGASGEVRDSSGNDLHGTAMKGANLSKDGMFGRAGHFDGTDDYVDFDNVEPLNFGTGPFSASVWINMDPDAPYQVGNKIVQKRGGRDKSWGEIPGWMMAVQRLGSSVYVKNTGVDENDEVDVDVQEDGRIEIHPRCEWDGSADIIVHEDTGGITRTIKIVEVGSENGKLHFPGSGDQILLAYVSPGSDLQPPYTYRWNIKNWGDVGSRQMLKLDLVPGDYLLTVEITDTMAKKVSGEFDISIGDDNRASESEPALTLGQVLYGFFFTSIMVMLAIVVITLIIIKNRQIQIGPKKQPGSAIDLAICDGGAVQWNERDGPSPGAPGGGPNNHPSHFQEFDHLVVGGILEDKQTPSNGPSHAPELHQGVFFGSLRRESIEWEGEAGMGMDDEQIRLALKRRLVDGDLSRKTYNKVLEKMQQQ